MKYRAETLAGTDANNISMCTHIITFVGHSISLDTCTWQYRQWNQVGEPWASVKRVQSSAFQESVTAVSLNTHIKPSFP